MLDPLKPNVYFISTGLRGSISHGDISMMQSSNSTFNGYLRVKVEINCHAKILDAVSGSNLFKNILIMTVCLFD